MRAFWPPAEAAQVDYESLREATLRGLPLLDATAGRFERGGLAALIVRPLSPPVFQATIVGAVRPAWTPYCDPRVDALAAVYRHVMGAANVGAVGEKIS